MTDVAGGDTKPRAGRVTLFTPQFAVVGVVDLVDLLPIALPPYPAGPNGRRTLILDLGGISFP